MSKSNIDVRHQKTSWTSCRGIYIIKRPRPNPRPNPRPLFLNENLHLQISVHSQRWIYLKEQGTKTVRTTHADSKQKKNLDFQYLLFYGQAQSISCPHSVYFINTLFISTFRLKFCNFYLLLSLSKAQAQKRWVYESNWVLCMTAN